MNFAESQKDRINLEAEVLREAAEALKENERLRKQIRQNEDRIRKLCRKFDDASGSRGFAPYHLRNACESRGFL